MGGTGGGETELNESETESRERLRRTFDEAPELYDRVRPRYPAEAVEDLVRLAPIGPASRVLEIGVGTGQLTVPLAETGCEIVGIELGPGLAAVATRNLARYARVAITVAAFEDWPLPEEPFDAVVSACAFHWIDPSVRVSKAADALRPDGALATLSAVHVAGGDAAFFEEVQRCYERWDPETTPPGLTCPAASEIPSGSAEIEESGRFGGITTRRYEWEVTYTTAQYVELLLSYSGHRALADDARRNLLDCIAALIDTRYGGRVTKRYLTELVVARRTA